MPTCHEIEIGTIYSCDVCGLTLKVISHCKRHGTPVQDCETCEGQYQFTITCCGKHLKPSKRI